MRKPVRSRIFVMAILVLSTILSLCCCTAGDSTTTTASTVETLLETLGTDPGIDSNFLAGFGEGDITPTESVPLQGYGDSGIRMSTGVLTSLYSHCLAVQDETGNIALMISVDSAAVGETNCNIIRSQIAGKTGVSMNNIIISSSHQHSSPDHSNSSVESSGRYCTLLIQSTVQAAVDAVADLSPAEVYFSSIETENMNFVRNYICNDGTYCGDNYGSSASGIKDHESVADATLQLLKFVRDSDKKDIVVANFQGHPHMGNVGDNYYKAHSDMVGVFRDVLSTVTGDHVMYFSGAGGNINMTSRIYGENISKDMWEHGERLAEYALEAEENYTKVETGLVRAKVATKGYRTDKSQEALYERAVEFMKIWNSQGQKAAQAAIKDYPEFHSIYHAKYVVVKHNLSATRMMTLYAISFGDVAFVGAPFEMFDTNGDEIKSGSPYKVTFITTMTNGSDGYVPSQLGYDNGGYSTDITRYASGTGEQIAQDFIGMLEQMHNF